jgi:protein-S-isoprenylcysteine O-methyltransferase Ste14
MRAGRINQTGESMRGERFLRQLKNIAARGGIIVFFIMAFEVMIMISPFAFFFYSVFNPILHFFESYPATRWLTAFFLPHMILPPTIFLKTVRILGSLLFILGAVTFAVCAFQVYAGKIFKWGVADRGLYGFIRHPQYLALALWGTGMAILWPRFLVLASLSLMLVLYYFLAKDEEKRMLSQFGGGYRNYMERTGMFLPRSIETRIVPAGLTGPKSLKYAAVALGVPVLVIGSGFALREVTLRSLSIEAGPNVALVTILPEDSGMSKKVLEAISRDGALGDGGSGFLQKDKDYLGYLMPADYVMQGMIANTGDEFHLHKQHHTVALIADWVLNPFEHLRQSPSVMMAREHHADPAMARKHHCPLALDDPALQCGDCPWRRIVFIEVDHDGKGRLSGKELFSLNTTRVPVCFIDVNVRSGEIKTVRRVAKTTAWKDVPTPAI